MNVVRFAPSPTGNIHIGNIRTAIFNYLFARNSSGQFILRIEDTDKERSTRSAIDGLLECMSWLGLDYDGEIFYQSSQEDAHRDAAYRLLKENKAYYGENKDSKESPILFRLPYKKENCESFLRHLGTTEITLAPEKELVIEHSGVKFVYINEKGKEVEHSASLAGYLGMRIFDLNGNMVFELDKAIDAVLNGKRGFSFISCSKIEFERREVFYNDLIKGELSKPLDSMKDFVILRSDSSPVFHLANVCDDITQGVTHIIRGDDHVENTYRHIFLFDALNSAIPKYGHMPMIVNSSGKPYSKRDGDAFVGDFRDKGYLSVALFNYLSLLGWSPGENKEKMSKDEMIKLFSLDRIKSAPAQFDIIKLLNMNGLYMVEIENSLFINMAITEARKEGWGDDVDNTLFEKVAILMKSRTKLITQISDWKYFFFDDSSLFNPSLATSDRLNYFKYDEKVLKKAFKDSSFFKSLKGFIDILVATKELNSPEEFELIIRNTEREFAIGEGKLNAPLRAALTGISFGAGIGETMQLLGKDRIGIRLNEVLKILDGSL